MANHRSISASFFDMNFRSGRIAVLLVAGLAALLVLVPASQAQILTTLHNFTGYPSDGAGLDSALTRASDGNFYGTTTAGGDGCGPHGCGTLFQMTPGGIETTLYSFCTQYPSPCTDGIDPLGTFCSYLAASRPSRGCEGH